MATVNGSDVDLAWTASAGATSYNVYYGLVAGVMPSSATLLDSVATTGATITAQPSASAYFAVTAVNGDGERASNEAMASVPSSGFDPLSVHQWHLLNTGQAGGTIMEDANVVPAWSAGFDGSGVQHRDRRRRARIAHEDLFWNCLPGASHDYADGSSDPTGGEHGTSCAGVAASAGGNDLGGRGAAFEAQLVGYNFLAFQTLASSPTP